MKGFSVTYERWSEADIEAGDTDDRGYVIEGVTLREAIQGGLGLVDPSWAGYCEANDSRPAFVRWLTCYDWNKYTHEWFETGIDETRALHIPDSVTAASRRRIARLFRIRGA